MPGIPFHSMILLIIIESVSLIKGYYRWKTWIPSYW